MAFSSTLPARARVFARSLPAPRASGVVLVLMLAIGFVPLFGGPGYEQALATGLVVPSAAAIAMAFRGSAGPASPLSMLLRGLGVGAWLSALSFVTALLHGARVGFCDLPGGARDFVLTGGAGALLGGTYGVVVGAFVRGRATRVLLAVLGPLSGIAVSLLRFYGSPAIFAFDPFFGYFSGALYDTVIDAGAQLVTYRLGSLATLGAVLLAASLLVFRDAGGGARSLRVLPLRGDPARLARLVLAVACAAASLGVTVQGPALGHWETAGTITKALGESMHGPRCDVVYPEGVREEQAALLLRDCEDDLRGVERALGARGPARVTAFFFRDAVEKKRLMGAADTYIAKPWRHEVYLQLQTYPHPVLGHELAHVVAGSFGRGPFRIAGALHGLLPNPGLIEGVAVAASPDDDELTPAQWGHAMADLGLLPPLARIFSLDFLAAPAARSYTVAGAFVRWVIDTHGAGALRAWYGGADLTALTATSWPDLDAAFRVALARTEVSPSALAYAKARFDRPGLFARHCPHVIDALRREAERCRDGLRIDQAVRLYDEVLKRDPHDAPSRLGLGATRLRFGDQALGAQDLTALAGDRAAPRTYRDRSGELLADQALLEGNLAAAHAAYQALLATQVDEDVARTLEVKAYASAHPEGAPAVAALLIGTAGRPTDPFEAAIALGSWAAEHHDPVAEYLVGRNLLQREFWRAAAPHLDLARRTIGDAAASETRHVRRELVRQRGIVACVLGEADVLAALRAEIAPGHPAGPLAGSSGRREALERLFDRCAAR